MATALNYVSPLSNLLPKSFRDSFSGASQRDELQKGYNKTMTALDEGFSGLRDQYRYAQGMFDPYTQGGRSAYDAYLGLQGLKGPDGAASSLAMYQANPYLQNEEQRLTKLGDARANALGQLSSGASAQAAANTSGNLRYQDYQGWQNRLLGLANQGFESTGQQAGLAKGEGDARYAHAQQLAGQETSFANAMAANKNTGLNNLLNVVGTVGKVVGSFGGMPK